jgi:hypothetical protein
VLTSPIELLENSHLAQKKPETHKIWVKTCFSAIEMEFVAFEMHFIIITPFSYVFFTGQVTILTPFSSYFCNNSEGERNAPTHNRNTTRLRHHKGTLFVCDARRFIQA